MSADSIKMDDSTWVGFQSLNHGVRFNYTYSELLSIIKRYPAKYTDLIWRIALMVCGVAVREGVNVTSEMVKPSENYVLNSRFIRLAGTIGNRRLSVRVVPEEMQSAYTGLNTNFILDDHCLYIEGVKVAEFSSFFVSDPIKSVAYITSNSKNETVLTINPNQVCLQDCVFCFKGYRHMTVDYKNSLSRLGVDQVCSFLKAEMPGIDYCSLVELMTLTGTFCSTVELLKYLCELRKGMLSVSNGKFDPARNDAQRLKISTHLLRTEDDMRIAKSHGVKRYSYPLEIFSDPLRKKLCKGSVVDGKGEVTFDEVFEQLGTASKVFGSNANEVLLVVGLDNFKDTKQGIERLSSLEGISITYNPFWAYFMDQIPLYQMSLEEIVDIIVGIEEGIGTSYVQKINF